MAFTYPNLILTIERFETPKYKNEKWSVLVGNDNADVRHVVPHNPGEEQIKPKQIQQVPQKKRNATILKHPWKPENAPWKF